MLGWPKGQQTISEDDPQARPSAAASAHQVTEGSAGQASDAEGDGQLGLPDVPDADSAPDDSDDPATSDMPDAPTAPVRPARSAATRQGPAPRTTSRLVLRVCGHLRGGQVGCSESRGRVEVVGVPPV